ncbi:LacI family DNA-binding transcriptional regulator [Propionivibrio soli]|uniref:LacI family DNA-binding transcriptional regulator n=1 Tax=Propionivibrio soli TaxID=2976531 RepID=UPI0021E91F53|nr:LacI family DNA-binding transcriptional regulator [Propionivibrio soli]
MTGKLKIQEIARQTGISISTVSRVLAGKSNTSAASRQRVLECARANGVLSNLSTGRLLFNHVVVFAPKRAFDLRADIFYYKVIQGIREAVEHQDVHLSYCAIEETDADIPLFMSKLRNPACDAAIVLGIDDPHVHALVADSGKPCVLVNCEVDSLSLDVVSPDHQLIGRASARYLIEHGHRDVLAVMCLRRITLERRLQGIRDAFAAYNVPFDDEHNLITTAGFTADEARAAIIAHLHKLDRERYPTAILAGGDFIASGIISALLDRGLAIPGDISVMSMDGFNLAETHDIALTAVHVPRDELGAEALRLLQQRITCPDTPYCHMRLSGKLVVRSSVKTLGRRKAKPAVTGQGHSLYGDLAT